MFQFQANFKNMSLFRFAFPRWVFFSSQALFLGFLLLFLWQLHSFSFPVILQFNTLQGIIQFGEPNNIIGLWIIFYVLSLLNLALGEYFFLRERFIAYVLFSLTVCITLIFSLVGILLFSIN